MVKECLNMTWDSAYRSLGTAYFGLGVPAFIFHLLFWLHVATHRSLRHMSMLWVYNYLFTDILLLLQLFLEYITRTSSSLCISSWGFSLLCNLEAYTGAYMAILEAYMLVCLNISRYFLIVKNYNIAVRYPYLLFIFNAFLYIIGLAVYLLQVEVFKIVRVHVHENSPSCHFQFVEMSTQMTNLAFVLIIPILLNCYFVAITTSHVRRSQQAARAQVIRFDVTILKIHEKRSFDLSLAWKTCAIISSIFRSLCIMVDSVGTQCVRLPHFDNDVYGSLYPHR